MVAIIRVLAELYHQRVTVAFVLAGVRLEGRKKFKHPIRSGSVAINGIHIILQLIKRMAMPWEKRIVCEVIMDMQGAGRIHHGNRLPIMIMVLK